MLDYSADLNYPDNLNQRRLDYSADLNYPDKT